MKLRIFKSIRLDSFQIKALLCDISVLHLEGDKIISRMVARILKTIMGVANRKSLRTPLLVGRSQMISWSKGIKVYVWTALTMNSMTMEKGLKIF